MCRLVAYLGTPILTDEIIIKPKNSLVHQSYAAEETDYPVNGDGFGFGWYFNEIREEPGLYKSIFPAWNDQNLLYNASFIKTNCFFAHVRAATVGGISIENTHPFRYEKFLMMHNGGIHEFERIKFDLIKMLDEESLLWIEGQNDTQYIIALFMTNSRKLGFDNMEDPKQLVACFNKTYDDIEKLKKKNDVEAIALYNIVFTDGKRLIATRYSTDPENELRTLYYIDKVCCRLCEQGKLRVSKDNPDRKAALIASEILTEEKDDWKEIPINHAIFIDENLDVTLYKLE
ncbi:MAG: class II glutamine amidotransferase [Bacteroidota bacterium]